MFGNLFELGTDLFAYNLKYLFFVGLWPSDEWAKANKLIYRLYEVTFYIVSATVLVITGIGTYRIKNNMIMLMSSLDKSLVAYHYVTKAAIFVYMRKDIEILVSEIIHSGDKISERLRKLMLTHVVLITCLSTGIGGIFTGLAFYKNEMAVEAWMPFNPMKSRMNLALSAQVLVSLFVPCICRAAAIQGIVCSLIMYLCEQLVDLQNRIRSLKFTVETESEMREEFKNIVEKHVRLRRYSLVMAKTCKKYFMVQNLAVTIEVCLNALMTTMVGLEQQSLLANFVAYLCVALLNAYIYCYLGNEMIVQSEGIALAAYESTWYTWPLDLQTDLLTLIRVAQKPLQLSAGGITVMSIQTFGQILSNGYSIFAVLNDVVD